MFHFHSIFMSCSIENVRNWAKLNLMKCWRKSQKFPYLFFILMLYLFSCSNRLEEYLWESWWHKSNIGSLIYWDWHQCPLSRSRPREQASPSFSGKPLKLVQFYLWLCVFLSLLSILLHCCQSVSSTKNLFIYLVLLEKH